MTKIAIWDVTSSCNLCCRHCAVRDTYEQAGHAALSFEDGMVVMRRLREAGYQHLQLLGGEPLVRPDIVAIVATAADLGFPSIRIVTNGTRLDAELAERLIEAGLTDLVLSVDGATAATNDDIRGRGSFDRAMRGAAALIERRGNNPLPRVTFQFTLTRSNLEEAPQMVGLAASLGADRFALNELRLAGGVLRDVEHLVPDLAEAMDAREAVADAAAHLAGTPSRPLQLTIFGRPRVIAYINDRYGIEHPLGMPDCSLVNGLRTVYVEANGRVSACSAAHVADGTSPTAGTEPPATDAAASGPTAEGQDGCHEPVYLHQSPLSPILASPRFDDVREIVDQALALGWQDEFIPCARCQYRPDCLICPIFLKERKDKMIPECLLAIQRHSRWRKATRSTKTGTPAAGTPPA